MNSSNEKLSTRLHYVRERKHFLNGKVYEVFEKFQVAILAYLGYALLIFTAGLKGEYSRDTAEQLLNLSHNVLTVMVVVFAIVMVLNIIEWQKYEKEENELCDVSAQRRSSQWFLWAETWMILIGIAEFFLIRLLIGTAVSIF